MRNRLWHACRTKFVLLFGLILPLIVYADAREHTLHQFGGNCWVDQENYNLISSLTADSKGNLYGTRACGPGLAKGGVFELSYVRGSGWRYSIIYMFPEVGLGGVSPQSGLTVDKSGNLYGTTVLGGANNCGVVYELTPNSSGAWAEIVLYNFASLPNAIDGCNPLATVVFDDQGNLYGTTSAGGMNGSYGVAFELSPKASNGGWSETVLHSFGSSRGPDGSNPNTNMIWDHSGNLYGTTPTGGQYTYGTVFELSPSSDGTWSETLIHQFTGASDGAAPYGVVFDSAGNLFGSASGPLNPYNGGEIFELSREADDTWSETVVHIFPVPSNSATGVPGQLSFDKRGILYGPLGAGGNSDGLECPLGCGAIFRMVPHLGSQWTYEQVYGFTGLNDGGVPMGPVIFDSKANVYGTTLYGGGNYGDGTIFQIPIQ